MNSQLYRSLSWATPVLRASALVLLFLGGFLVVLVADLAERIENHGLQFLGGVGPVRALCFFVAGLAALYVLVRYAEITLALFFLIGMIKGDERLASTPLDLTVAVGGVVLFSICIRLIAGRQKLALPREYLLYLPLVAMMVISLAYTPDISGGLDKILRFFCLTSIGIIAPFVLFDSASKLRNFFVCHCHWRSAGGQQFIDDAGGPGPPRLSQRVKHRTRRRFRHFADHHLESLVPKMEFL